LNDASAAAESILHNARSVSEWVATGLVRTLQGFRCYKTAMVVKFA